MKRLLCFFGFHDLHSPSEGHEKEGPGPGSPMRVLLGDSPSMVKRKFAMWTEVSCTRCGYAPRQKTS